jgi:hypothetical protein
MEADRDWVTLRACSFDTTDSVRCHPRNPQLHNYV